MEPRIRERHVSPDGLLTLIVLDCSDDIAIGFDGLSFHVHPDQLAGRWHVTEEEAVKEFIDDTVDNRVPIAVSRLHGAVEAAAPLVWPSDADPESNFKHLAPGETVEFRYWDGRGWEPN